MTPSKMSHSIICLWTSSSLALSSLASAQTSDVPANNTDTLYDDSFTSGDVAPSPPPEGEPDTSGIDGGASDGETGKDRIANPERNPDSKESFYDPDDTIYSEAFRLGVSGALAVPHVVNIGVESLFLNRKFGASVNHGNISRNIDGVDVELRHMDVRFRYFPTGTAFFTGLAVGQHTLVAQQKKDISFTYKNASNVDTKANVKGDFKLTTNANYVIPHVGWFAVWEPGFTMGFDLGWLVPYGAKSKADISGTNIPAGQEELYKNTTEYKSTVKDIEDTANDYSKKSLPFVSMLRIGWMF